MLEKSTSVIFLYIIPLIVIVPTWIWSVIGELRTKVVSVAINMYAIKTKSFLGFGAAKEFLLKDIDGFTTSILTSNTGEYEYLYLMTGDKKIVKISGFYHKNYLEMKQFLATKLPFLGDKPFDLWAETKEIFR